MQYFTCILFATVSSNTIAKLKRKVSYIQVEIMWNLSCPKADMCLLYSHFIVKNIILLLPTFLQYNKIWQTATKRLLSYVRWKYTTNDICVMYIFCEGNIRLQNLHFFSQENAVKYWSPYYNITFSCWNNQKLIYRVLFLKNAISGLKLYICITGTFWCSKKCYQRRYRKI